MLRSGKKSGMFWRYPRQDVEEVSRLAKQTPQSVRIRINETDRALLVALGERVGGPNARVSIPNREFADRINMSVQTVRRSCQKLERMGLIRSWRTKRADGSFDANRYEVTLVGWAVLKGASEQDKS